MLDLRLKALLGATALSIAAVSAAQAGGFSRGNADTDILFEEGNFNMRAGVTYVSPSREFSNHTVPGLIGTKYTEDYVIPSASVKFNLSDNFRCAGTIVDNNGGAVRYAVPTASGKLEEDFTTNEKAITCGIKFAVGPGNLWALGGGFMENFDYSRTNAISPLPGPIALPNAHLTLRGQEFGYRVGVAYEITDIAFRAQLMYRSGTSYGAEGELQLPTAAVLGAQAQGYQAAAMQAAAAAAATADPGQKAILLAQAQSLGATAATLLGQAVQAANAGASTTVPAIGSGNLPQSVEFKLQSGIAPNWLAFASVKWADWSVQKALVVNSAITNSNDIYNWRDGWTVTGGVGHKFNDSVSGLVSVTWDRGVGTGWDWSSDTWTLAVGASIKDKLGGELRGGVGYTYIAAATEYASGTGNSVKAGHAIAGSLGYAIKW